MVKLYQCEVKVIEVRKLGRELLCNGLALNLENTNAKNMIQNIEIELELHHSPLNNLRIIDSCKCSKPCLVIRIMKKQKI